MIHELKKRIVLNERGEGEWKTPLINGMLKTIIIIPEPNQQMMMSVSTDDLMVLDESDIKKTKVFAPAIQPSTEDGLLFSQNCVEWPLNEPLYFKFYGSMNRTVDVKVRWA